MKKGVTSIESTATKIKLFSRTGEASPVGFAAASKTNANSPTWLNANADMKAMRKDRCRRYRSATEMADFIGDQDFAAQCRDIFAKGKTWADKNLFNGEYYGQLINLENKSILEQFTDSGTCACSHGNAVEQYWSAEHGEIKMPEPVSFPAMAPRPGNMPN